MKEIQEYEKDIASIRTLMERSSKFLSLSGLSGILAGLYALGGAAAAYYMVYDPLSLFQYRSYAIQDTGILLKLTGIATLILTAALVTGFYLSSQKAKKEGETIWTPATQRLLINFSIPLCAGGIFILILLFTGHFGLAAPACLIFYGIALVQVSSNTFDEVRYLGFFEILLGLISAAMPGYGLLFWALGFGVLHIIYGAILYKKYDS